MNSESLAIARAYHDSWTSRDFDAAIGLLSNELQVEVPINDYPTVDSFASALVSFGSNVKRVDLLSEMSARDEAMLLYDMEVEAIGNMRVAEHFTVSNGKIIRLRQIHDTAGLRAAGPPRSSKATGAAMQPIRTRPDA